MLNPILYLHQYLSESTGLVLSLDDIRLCHREGVDIYTPYFQDQANRPDFSLQGLRFDRGFLNWRIDDDLLLEFSQSFLSIPIAKHTVQRQDDISQFSLWHGKGDYEDEVYENPLFCLVYACKQSDVYARLWPDMSLTRQGVQGLNEEQLRLLVFALCVSHVLHQSEQKTDKSLFSAYVSQLAQDFLICYNALCALDEESPSWQLLVSVMNKSLQYACGEMNLSCGEH